MSAVRVIPDAPQGPPPRPRSFATAVLVSMRPRQWTKNLFVLAPVAFAGVTGAAALVRVGLTFVAFCLAASALYLVNDVLDRDLDRQHARKRLRPIASGELGVRPALAVAGLLAALALGLSVAVSATVVALVAVYAVSVVAYSAGLKHVEILDVLIIASGFVLRVAAGTFALDVTPSNYLLLCTMFLALFLGFGKRRHELLLLEADARSHRPVLSVYTRELLDEFLSASMIGALLSYAMYTFFSQAATEHELLPVTIPFATYGLFRYMLLVHTRSEGGAPEELLLTDRPLQLSVLLWAAAIAAVIYAVPGS